MDNRTEIVEARPDGLSPKMARLAEAVVLDGLSKQAAIKAAGYASESAGYAALRTEKMAVYQQQLIREHLLESSISAAQTVRALITQAKSEYVRLEASKDVLDRAGFSATMKHAHLHGGQLNIKIDLS